MKTLVFLLSGCVLIAACKNEQAPAPAIVTGGKFDCDKAKITTDYVMNAFQANCRDRKCHPGASPRVADFSTAEKLKTYVSTRPAAFEARVTGPQADMPQSKSFPPLTQGMKDSIACWVKHGMPDQ